MDRHAFSRLVSAIYDGAIDVALWPQTLGLICETFGFRKGTIDLNRVPDMTNLFNFHHGIDREQAVTMVSHYRGMPEVWGGIAATMTRAIDRPWIVSRIMSQEALLQTAYYRSWVEPMGLVDGAAIVLARDDSLFGSIRLATDSRRGIIDDTLVDALTLLLPHCQRAARISGLLDVSRSDAQNFRAVIDAMSVPIVLVSADCAVVYANVCAQAILEDGAMLMLRHGRLASPVQGLQHAIQKTIRQLAENETDIPGKGIGMAVRGTDNSAHTLHLLPLVSGALRPKLAEDAVAAIFVSNAAGDRSHAPDVFKSIFKLSDTQIRVLEHVVAGKSTQQIGAELGIASSTVRTHVLHLFQKTETHCRADLVRLAHALAKPVMD